MANYDFSTLNSADLEELVCDLLNAELENGSPGKYRTFKDGRDAGIDILYSIEGNDHEHVGQVKHYYRTGIKGLLAEFKNNEVDNVRKLDPGKYIVATSVDLTQSNTKKISQIFKPYIKSLSDIYGKKDLNRLIEDHESVLDVHYKLWLSDASVLKKILSSDLEFRSTDFFKEELTKRIRIYVKTDLFDIIREDLKINNFVVITGEPGVGKTTLAEMLTYEYIKEGYKLHYIIDDISEVEKVLKDDNSKQIFYFDDFLGSNSAEINRAQGSERALTNIIKRIKRMTNKKMIFTTRSIVLNTVTQNSERFRRFNRSLNETVFHLGQYGDASKEMLLRNHIDESTMGENLKRVIRQHKIFNFVVSHENFNPRSVEYITLEENIEDFDEVGYEKFIYENFNNPSEIWKHAYEHQIDDIDRWILNTLLTFNQKVDINLLEAALNKRLEVCVDATSKIKVNAFQNSIGKLDKGFLIRRGEIVDFINPSLKDFLNNYLQHDSWELTCMLSSIKYVLQLSKPFLEMLNKKNIFLPDNLKNDFILNYSSYTRKNYEDEDLIYLATIINNYIKGGEKDAVLVEIIESISDWEALYKNYELNMSFKEFVSATRFNERVSLTLKERTEEIVNDLFVGENDLEAAIDLLVDLTDIFELDFNDFNESRIVTHLDDLFGEHIENEIESLKEWITEVSEIDDFRDNLERLGDKISDTGLIYTIDQTELECDWEYIADHNNYKRLMEKD